MMRSLPRNTIVSVSLFLLALAGAPLRSTADWPMLGRSDSHNPVVPEGKLPTEWDFETGKNVKWMAKLGSMTCGDPVVADGLVWVGTNNSFSDDFDYKDDAGVLACFRESDGELLYKYVSPRLDGRDRDWPYSSLASSPLVEGDRIWFVTNRWETVCLDVGPLKRGEGEPRPVWKCDMVKQLAIHPYGGTMHWNRLPSVASHGHRIFVVTGNGVAAPSLREYEVSSPRAPSLVCFHKESGKILWKDNSPGDHILSVQWSTPLVAEIEGRVHCVVPQGDGWIRSFDATTGKLIWKFDMNPKESTWAPHGQGTRNNVLAAPVLYEGKVYIASGQMPSYGHGGSGRLVCLDPAKTGDISSKLAVDEDGKRLPHRRVQAVDPDKGEKAISNPNSGLVWEFVAEKVEADEKLEFAQEMHRCAASVAVHDGLVIAADSPGAVHCLDAETGERYWGYDTLSTITAAPLIVGDRVYIADHDGDVAILGLSSEPDVAMRKTESGYEPLAERQVRKKNGSIYASPVFANGTLYVATRSRLFAIAENEPDQEAVGGEEQTGGHWPQWRGPKRDNVSTETGLLKEWPDDGPPLRWQADGLGTGIACLAIADGRILTLGYQDGQEFALALNEKTGKLDWANMIGPAVEENRFMRWLAQRTPTIDGQRAYVLAASGDLLCLSTTDGKVLWRRSYVEDFGAKPRPWGMADYPLVDGDRLVCTPH